MPSRTAELSLPGVSERCQDSDLVGRAQGQRTAAQEGDFHRYHIDFHLSLKMRR